MELHGVWKREPGRRGAGSEVREGRVPAAGRETGVGDRAPLLDAPQVRGVELRPVSYGSLWGEGTHPLPRLVSSAQIHFLLSGPFRYRHCRCFCCSLGSGEHKLSTRQRSSEALKCSGAQVWRWSLSGGLFLVPYNMFVSPWPFGDRAQYMCNI